MAAAGGNVGGGGGVAFARRKQSRGWEWLRRLESMAAGEGVSGGGGGDVACRQCWGRPLPQLLPVVAAAVGFVDGGGC